jgi:hypothetical protein
MNNPDHISESLKPFFLVKILKFLDADPGSGLEKILIRDPVWIKLGSGINIPDPQHCINTVYFLIMSLRFRYRYLTNDIS